MSFGFSVGDFIAVGKLIAQVSSALHESTGASAEYQSVLLRLDSLREILGIADLSIRGYQLVLPRSAANAILNHLEQCSVHLRKFNTVIEKHRKSLSKGGSGNRIKDSWRKVGWSLFTKEEIKEINEALEGDMSAISMMLEICGTLAVTEMVKKAQEHERGLKAIERAIPASLRYAWNPDHKPIFFITALDQRLELPYELCYEWKTFRDIVNKIFEGFPASEWVNHGFYEIIDENNRETVLGSKNWEGIIKPDMVISMNVLLRMKKGRDPESASCPSCGELYRGYPKSNELERVRCRRCTTWFQISSGSRIAEVLDDDGARIQHGAIRPMEKEHARSRNDIMDKEGQRFFRRWHIIWEENKEALESERLVIPGRPGNSASDKRMQIPSATFQCALCPERFSREYDLLEHLRLHKDERPFACAICNKVFANQYDWGRHTGLRARGGWESILRDAVELGDCGDSSDVDWEL